MAVTNNENQVLWSAANSKSVAANTSETSDAITMDATCIQASITCKADNDGTPAAADTVDFFWLGATYDPDGSGSVEYDTAPGVWLCRVDTSVSDPAQRTVQLNSALSGGKVTAKNNSPGGGRAITVSCTILEKRFA